MLIIKNTKTIDLRCDWYMYKPYNIEKMMVSAFCHTLAAIWTGPSCITGTAVGSPRVCTCSMNTRVIGTVVYIWNISTIFLKIILRNYKDLKRLNSLRKIKVLPISHKGPCHPWLHVHWKEPSVFEQTPLLHGDVRHSSISTNIKN